MKKNDAVKLIALSILVIVAYLPTFIWMVERWSVRDTYYSHGFLVPLISVFIIWLKRNELKRLRTKPVHLGWVFFMGGLLVHLVSTPLRISFVSGFSLIATLFGLVLLLLGKEYLRILMFPILFLNFMIPLPMVAIANLSFRLKLFAAQISTFIINKLGIPAIREGSIIRTMHSVLMVEDPCSGIRSLVALIALGALMAYFSGISKTKKTILFLCSIPIAISTNIIRIVALSLVSEIYGAKAATGWFHDTMGILVFVFAFVGLAAVGKILE